MTFGGWLLVVFFAIMLRFGFKRIRALEADISIDRSAFLSELKRNHLMIQGLHARPLQKDLEKGYYYSNNILK